MTESIRVLIADDHPFFRDGLRMLLHEAADMELVGQAEDGDEAVAMAATLQPDVVLMDIQMPGLNGIDATRRILNASPHISVIVVTMYEDDHFLFTAMRAGARGYLLKGADREDMLRAIRAAAAGDAIFGPAIAKRLIGFFANPAPLPRPAFPELTEREREILGMLARGHSNPEIADRLFLSPKTVRNHVSNIMSKLEFTGRAEAIVRAREAGLGQVDSASSSAGDVRGTSGAGNDTT
ncbi:MAG: response regulator transcription factor [Chloroflexia bacterium]|nr:response regulator transcription factor [Chloroflexia bacterium]